MSEAPSETLTARGVVLQKCEQEHPVPFSDVYCDEYVHYDTMISALIVWDVTIDIIWIKICFRFLRNCKKIGEGLYGEVFKWNDGTNSSVIKIIPIDGEELVNGERQKKFDEILSEIVIAQYVEDYLFSNSN